MTPAGPQGTSVLEFHEFKTVFYLEVDHLASLSKRRSRILAYGGTVAPPRWADEAEGEAFPLGIPDAISLFYRPSGIYLHSRGGSVFA